MNPVLISTLLALLAAGVLATVRWPRAMAVNLWSFITTVLVTSGLIIVLPTPFAATVLWAGLVLPVLWVALQWWAYWDQRRWRPTAAMVMLSIAGAAVIATMEPSL